MSVNPAPKTGYAKSGKSLKALRRYYALMNEKQKSPDEDKLSKRIAAELKTQQDANEKRSKRESTIPLMEQSTTMDKPESPRLLVSPKETGPVFIAPTPTPAEQGVGSKSIAPKSIKSFKSTNAARTADCTAGACKEGGCCSKMLYVMLGFLVGLPIGLLVRDGISKLMKSSGARNGTEVGD